MRAVTRGTSAIMSDLEKYLSFFNRELDKIKVEISNIDNSIVSVKKELNDAENNLKTKLDDIANKNKRINAKLHDVSGDYDELYLINAAEELKQLRTAKEDIEKDSKELTDELKRTLSELQEEKNSNETLKNKITEIKSNAEKELKESYRNCDAVIKAIRKAIEVCSNPNLTIALDEEEEQKEKHLENIADKYVSDVEILLDKKIDIKPIEKDIDNKEDIFENRETVEVDNKVEIDIEEPEKEAEDVLSETSFDEDRKIIDIKTISEEQVTAIENSSVVENGLKAFFI